MNKSFKNYLTLLFDKLICKKQFFLILLIIGILLLSCNQNSENDQASLVATAVESESDPQLGVPTITSIPVTVSATTIDLDKGSEIIPSMSMESIILEQSNWDELVSQIVWVAYTPPDSNPNIGLEATIESIFEDLSLLSKAGFTGLVTYSSDGVLGNELPNLAQELGFQGLIMGVWDPFSDEEINSAINASELPIVLGYSVGNEGLDKRYNLTQLTEIIEELRLATNKRVTTTEEVDDYLNHDLLELGDWVFPNVHPYFHSIFDPETAVRWTNGAYDNFIRRSDRFVLFKEVGLPTAGDSENFLSESNQLIYYQMLAATNTQFVYFEAFDQPWKTHLPIEPHWGIFESDGSAKLIASYLMGEQILPLQPFYIYKDADFHDNHFKPTGFMGDIGDIEIDETYTEDSFSGTTAIRVLYKSEGLGPNECSYDPPCGWAGVYWQEPPNNWGLDEFLDGAGFDLSAYDRLVFWARADESSKIEFKVGGIAQPYGDSLIFPEAIFVEVGTEWKEYSIDLQDVDISHIIGGFVWAANMSENPDGITFYLDEIRFELQEK